MFAFHKNYVKKCKCPLDEVGDQQQCHHFSNYMEATTAKMQEENISHSKLFGFGLMKKYFWNKSVSKIGKSTFQDKDNATSSQ